MATYARETPRDKQGEPIQNAPPAFQALEQNYGSSAVSSVITLTDGTTLIEVGAIGGGGVVMKWITTGDTAASVVAAGASANWDNFIPADTVRQFVVPIEKVGTTSVVGINKQMGLFNRVAFIAAAVPSSSVLSSEF